MEISAQNLKELKAILIVISLICLPGLLRYLYEISHSHIKAKYVLDYVSDYVWMSVFWYIILVVAPIGYWVIIFIYSIV